MSRVHREALVPYSAAQMFALVNDVERYPEFLPGCAAAQILSREAQSMRATLTLAKGGFRQSFTTDNRWQENAELRMELREGPFKSLHGLWRFEPLGEDGCRISVTVDFEFASLLGGLAFGPAFQKLVHSLIEAFQQRAREIYGGR
jgi:ribosome-associated toxin RatA of RatAB toxin-antitoxin module